MYRQQPWLHEYAITVDGPVTVVATQDGDLGTPGTGLFADDRRVVRTLRLLLDGTPPVLVASSATGATSEHWSAARHLDDAVPDPTVEVHRRRSITGLVVTEQIVLRSRKADPVATELTLSMDGDFADLSAVKAGHVTVGPTAVDAEHLGWADERHDLELSTVPPPAESTAPDGTALVLRWPVVIEPGDESVVEVTWTIRRRATTDFDADAASSSVDWDADAIASSISDPRLAQLVRVGLDDLRHLTLRDPLDPGDFVAAAGTPWYLTLFGRDAIWAARFMAAFSPGLARGTLRTLARRQADSTDADIAAEPGKILHELRRTSAMSTGLGLPPLYYGTVDATPLWIALLRDAWHHGLSDEDVTALLPHLEAALGWLERNAAASPDGLLRYRNASGRGLANQGWKDSGDAMRMADGSLATAPIALLEAQAYAVEAAFAAVDIGRSFGRDFERWSDWADTLSQRVRDRFWVGEEGDRYLAMAIDGAGEPVDGVGSNMGHALGTGLLTPSEAARVVERLLRPDMLRTFGIGTLSSDNPAYNPIGYHTGSIWTHDTAIIALGMAREGFTAEAATVAERIVRLGTASDDRLPELCAGEAVGRRPVPYPAACRPQAWAAASAAAVLAILEPRDGATLAAAG